MIILRILTSVGFLLTGARTGARTEKEKQES